MFKVNKLQQQQKPQQGTRDVFNYKDRRRLQYSQ